MMRSYYPIHIRLDGSAFVLVWYNNDQDGVLLDKNRTIPVFSNLEQCLSALSAQDMALKETDRYVIYDIDIVQQWLQKTDDRVDCKAFLDVWNLLDDVRASYGIEQDYRDEYDEADEMYEKLFYGCNLPSITPEGEHYKPEWSEIELYVMSQILREGIALLKSKIVLVS